MNAKDLKAKKEEERAKAKAKKEENLPGSSVNLSHIVSPIAQIGQE